MLFKTISASVYGIDAYLVEVEVVKSALRNCGFEFPYGQGVTIHLAPADVRKEGSGFDLPMALGLAGCSRWTNACF